ncbi:hypothetical protein D3C72_2438510 [compost metagenome]
MDMLLLDMPSLLMLSLPMLSAAYAAVAPRARHRDNAAVVILFMMRSLDERGKTGFT